jgi:hypothetical protein
LKVFSRLSRPSCLSCLVVVLVFVAPLSAQTPTAVTAHTEVPPVEIGDAIEALLAAGGERVAIGDRTIEFWWVKSLPLRTGTTESAWKSVDEGALVGAVKLSSVFSDARGAAIKPGTYTLRYALQAAGSNSRASLLLLRVDDDTSVSAIGHDNAIAMSKAVTHTAFPAAWTIVPPAAAEAVRTILRIGRRSASVIFAVPVSRDGADAGSIKFGVRLPGLIPS